ncbi:MAG: hypothetical protein AMJ42_05020 [Deltaproteobacteria bacterium DG_8]|nr:MAG: hypothetical protein AMJ42_05020 [Deltaproteobacteria bacterium DG_8]
MVRKSVCLLCTILFTFSLLWFSSCARRVVREEEGIAEREETKEIKGEGITEEELEEARKKVAELREKEGIKLSNIYFAFDDFSLSEQAKKTLVENAAWIMNNTKNKIIIEGHCDERGTEEYNIALGERRSNSSKRYLINLGVKSDQLSTISYGEERPADQGHNEESWAKNRRAVFVIK